MSANYQISQSYDVCAFMERNGVVKFEDGCVIQNVGQNSPSPNYYITPAVSVLIFLLQVYIIYRQHCINSEQKAREKQLAYLEENYALGVGEPIKEVIIVLEGAIDFIEKKKLSSSLFNHQFAVKEILDHLWGAIGKSKRLCREADKYVENGEGAGYGTFYNCIDSVGGFEGHEDGDSINDFIVKMSKKAIDSDEDIIIEEIIVDISDVLREKKITLRRALAECSKDYFKNQIETKTNE